MQPTPETTLAVIIGASEFPRLPQVGPNDAFRNSAFEFRSYLLDKDGFALPDKNLIDLFDSQDAAAKQDDEIASFLQTRVSQLKESEVIVTDLILYYVGHGGFFSPNDQYFLALRNTKEGSESISGYPIHSLANTLKDNATHLRRYLILDCCFSAAAYQAFQSGPLEVARQKTLEQLPPKGTALLCAAGPREPAKAPPNLRYTMFSGVLLDILKNGSTDLPERLSLIDLERKIRDTIREQFPDMAVRPQVGSPDQIAGDIAHLPIFPNLGLGAKSVQEFLSRLEETISNLVKSQEALESKYSYLKSRLDDIGSLTANTSGSNSAEAYAEQSFDKSVLHKYPWLRSAGLTKVQWDKIPGSVKKEIIAHWRRKSHGKYWLYTTAVISLLSWTWSILGFNSLREFESPQFIKFADVFTAICATMMMLQIYSRLKDQVKPLSASPPSSNETPRIWEDYDVVIEARSQKWQNVFGLELEHSAVSISILCYLVTFVGTLIIRLSPILWAKKL